MHHPDILTSIFTRIYNDVYRFANLQFLLRYFHYVSRFEGWFDLDNREVNARITAPYKSARDYFTWWIFLGTCRPQGSRTRCFPAFAPQSCVCHLGPIALL